MARPQHALDHPLPRGHARLDIGNRAVAERRHAPRDSNRSWYAIFTTDPAVDARHDLMWLPARRRFHRHSRGTVISSVRASALRSKTMNRGSLVTDATFGGRVTSSSSRSTMSGARGSGWKPPRASFRSRRRGSVTGTATSRCNARCAVCKGNSQSSYCTCGALHILGHLRGRRGGENDFGRARSALPR